MRIQIEVGRVKEQRRASLEKKEAAVEALEQEEAELVSRRYRWIEGRIVASDNRFRYRQNTQGKKK